MTISPSTSNRISADNLNSILITHPVASPYPVFSDFPTQKNPSSLCQRLGLLPYPRKTLKHKVAFALAHLKTGRPWRLSDEEPTCQCGRPAWGARAGKAPGGGSGHPTPVFLPAESRGLRSLAGCSPRGRKNRTRQRARAHTHTHRHTRAHTFWDVSPRYLVLRVSAHAHTHTHTHTGSHLLGCFCSVLGAKGQPGPHRSTVELAVPPFWGHSQVVKHLQTRSDRDRLS